MVTPHRYIMATDVTTTHPGHAHVPVVVKYGCDTPQKHPTCSGDHHGHVRAMHGLTKTHGPQCPSQKALQGRAREHRKITSTAALGHTKDLCDGNMLRTRPGDLPDAETRQVTDTKSNN